MRNAETEIRLIRSIEMDTSKMSEIITYSTVLIECKYSDGSEGSGTGFIINLHDKDNNTIPSIVTNEHVVNNSIQTIFRFCKADNEGNPIDNQTQSVTYIGPAWKHHPDSAVDLVCLPITSFLESLENTNTKVFYIPLEISMIPDKETIDQLTAMEDVIMVGYPIGLSDRYNNKPIIRKGITASHPKLDYQGKKDILLDIASFPGSSGSPVFLLKDGLGHDETGVYYTSFFYLLGVLYCGPMFNAEGVLQFATLPSVPTPVLRIPINLGVIIKSERLLEFESIL